MKLIGCFCGVHTQVNLGERLFSNEQFWLRINTPEGWRYPFFSLWVSAAFSTLLNQCHIELRQFWRWKGVKHSISMVFLIIL